MYTMKFNGDGGSGGLNTPSWRRDAWVLLRHLHPTRPLLLPSVLVLGAQKAGTTALFAYLAQHPLFLKPLTKEIHYWDLHVEHRSYDWYLGHFPHRPRQGGVVTGEATPSYLYHPLVPERLSGKDAGLRFVVLLRNPVQRAISHYHHEVRLGRETLDPLTAIRAEPGRLDGQDSSLAQRMAFSYVDRGRYAVQVERWLSRFDRDRFIFLSWERLLCSPREAMAEVFSFLGIGEFDVAPLVRNAATYATPADEVTNELRRLLEPDVLRLRSLKVLDAPWIADF